MTHNFLLLYSLPTLGWQIPRADFSAGLGIFAPTGKYEPGGDENLGTGMWGFEVFAGTTVYFDKAKNWHFALTAFYETHTEKKDTNIRVGDVMTIEGGLGRSFLQGAANAGVAYYAQWKLTNDDLRVIWACPLYPPQLAMEKAWTCFYRPFMMSP